MNVEWILNYLNATLATSLFFSAILCFLGGVLASLTPCVYPLIPVVATYIGTKSTKQSRFTSFYLSLSYVMGMAFVYSILGVIAAYTGSLFGKISTHPISYFFVGNLFIFLGLNVFDVICLPVIGVKNTDKKGVIGAFLVGGASGLITSPCTTPILGAVLFYVAKTKSIFSGIVLMFSFSIGMGILLILVGTFSGLITSLPKPGVWMERVKKLLGFVLIGIGEYFLIKMGQMLI